VSKQDGDRTGHSTQIQVALGALWLAVALLLLLYWLTISPSVDVYWQTETEFETAGFNVLRGTSPQGPFVKINESLLLSAADPLAGDEYLFIDSGVVAGETYYYRLEDVELDGQMTQHDLISATAPGKPGLLLVLSLFVAITGIAMIVHAWRRGE
jgi:hypothetical protein